MPFLLAPPSFDDILTLLRAWRLWLLGAVLGSLLGAVIYLGFPPDFRARATVIVDFNIEQSWPEDSDREIFYTLDREARKLAEIAWEDEIIEELAKALSEEPGEVKPIMLRNGRLSLSHPADGAWHFYADSPSAIEAVKLASLWAQAFTLRAREGIKVARTLYVKKKLLETEAASEELLVEIHKLELQDLGVTYQASINPVEIANLPVARKTGMGLYALAGALAGMFLLSLGALFIKKPA